MNEESTNLVERVRFGTFELNVRTGELVSIGTDPVEPESAKVLLREQPFRILRILVERQGQMVTRQEIRQILWPNDTFVDYERSINVAMAILRKALADDADHPKYIETLARRGYRLIVPVEWQESAAETPRLKSLQTSTPLPANRNGGLIGTRIFRYRVLEILAIVALVLILVTAAALFWRHHSGIELSSSDTLVLADVTNQTSDPALDEGLSFALLVALGQTPYLNLLGSDKVHETARRLGLSEDNKITPLVTPRVALQVCRKTNSRAVVSASIKDVGNRFRIVLSAIGCESGKTLHQEVHEAETRDDIVRTLGLSASQLRARLGESRDSLRRFNQPLDQATSSSPEALQFLALGYEKQLSGDIPDALAYYGRAIEKDPNFGLAYAAQGSANHWLDKHSLALVGLSKAFELRGRLTVPSRFHVETIYYGDGRHEWDKECRVAQEWVHTFPRDVIARTNFGYCLAYLGRLDERLVQSREAARLLPSSPALMNLLVAAMYAQRFDEAREAYDEAIQRGLDSPGLHFDHARLAFLQNDKSAMQKEWAWASQDPARGRFVLLVRNHESRAEGFYGRSRNAHRLAQMNVDSSTKAGSLADAADFEAEDALRDAETGNLRESQSLVTDALRKSQDRNVLMSAALTFARAGNAKQSQILVEKLNQLYPENFSIEAFGLPTTRAAIELAKNDPAAAVELLRPVEPYDLAYGEGFDNVYPAYLRGLAYLQLKQGILAAAEFQKVLDHSGVVAGFVTGAIAKLQLARAQVLTHDTKAARKSYEDFLMLWKNADPDLPIYKEARAEYAALRKTAQ